MAESFFIFTMGPIQDFIASARRCQDLWYGSWLLSHLSCKVAEMIQSECGEDALIFPGSSELNSDNGISNKIVAIVPAEQVKDLAQKAKKTVKTQLLAELDKSIKEALSNQDLRHYFDDKRAREQVKEMMEFFWVAVPCKSREGTDYVSARSRAEELLTARKNVRNWGAVAWGAYVPKDSLDGSRESVIHEDLYDRIKDKTVSKEKVRRLLGIEGAERLCGVGLLKRVGGKDKERSFHSTAHMAARILGDYFVNPETQNAFDAYVQSLSSLLGNEWLRDNFRLAKRESPFESSGHWYDGGIFFEHRLLSLLPDEKEDKKENVRRVLRLFLKNIRHPDLPIPEPRPYFALLLADGDKMGKAIDQQASFEKHKEISTALDGFSKGVKDIVEGYQGSLIYSGGDDVLALLPMHKAVVCAHKLAEDFKAKLKPFVCHDGEDTIEPTLSVGIAIAHFLKPFGRVREQAKEAEKLAKVERNSLAMIIDKRSGGSRQIKGLWETEDIVPLHKRLDVWEEMIKQNELNRGFLYEVEQISSFGALRSPEEKETNQEDLQELLLHELERVMARKEPGSKQRGLGSKARDTLRAFVGDEVWSGDFTKSLQALSNELYFALELSRTEAIAYPTER